MPTQPTFPSASSARPFRVLDRPRRRTTRRVFVLAIVTIAAVLVGGFALASASDNASSGYRTATASPQSIDQVVNEVGVVEPVSQAAVAFPVSGTVATVDVAVGDTVAVSSALATLDTTSLQATVNSAQADLDQAELTLERALDGEDVGANGSASSAIPASYASASAGTEDTATTAILVSSDPGADDELRAAQQAVLDGQRQVDEDLRAADAALASAQEICAALGESTEGDTSDDTDTTATDDISACQTALTAVLDAQRKVQTSQNTLASASSALDALLAARASQPTDDGATAPGSGGATQTPGGSTPPTTSGGSGSPGGESAPSTSSSPSSEDLIAYQKAVDAAELQLAVAEQALEQATIHSPIDGTVVAVNVEVGEAVSAGSTTANITIVGNGGYEVTATVSVDDMPDLEVGQATTIIPDGATDRIAGEIVSIGVVGTSDNGTTTYPVTIGITGDASGLRNGSIASVGIVTANATEALAVPTSAVHVDNGQRSVTVLEGGSTRDVDVEIGAVGSTWTEITSGLTNGQTVVIADLSEPLPGSATDGDSGGVQGGFPGGGFPGGGFPGGGFPAGG